MVSEKQRKSNKVIRSIFSHKVLRTGRPYLVLVAFLLSACSMAIEPPTPTPEPTPVSVPTTPTSLPATTEATGSGEDSDELAAYAAELDDIFVQFAKLAIANGKASSAVFLSSGNERKQAITTIRESLDTMEQILGDVQHMAVPNDERARLAHEALLSWMNSVLGYSTDLLEGKILAVGDMVDRRDESLTQQIIYLQKRDALTPGRDWIDAVQARIKE